MRTFVLDADLGIEAASGLRDTLAPAVAARRPVAIDGSSVARLHCASMQVLVAFAMARSAAGRSTRISDPAPILRDAARALGMTRTLGLDTTETVQ
ncbi:MAG: STAS domain-containing protein [Pseudomonadota bacterium]|jgi:anti-anti-sigma regulatory factor